MRIIKKLTSIFNKNKVREFSGKNKKKMLREPRRLPKKSRSRFVLSFSNLLTAKSSKKSKKKFRNSTKSRYIFMLSPDDKYIKKEMIFLSFLSF